ncbi:MAG: hypothetical protein ABI462_00905 [Ignavibacteria bacterium]
MKTRHVLLITQDKELSGIVKISALTLTKLNAQVTIDEASEYDAAVERSKPVLIDLIIIDGDIATIDPVRLIDEIRNNTGSDNKKIILLYSTPLNREEIFKAGCDSIMSKNEFKRAVNNILTM